MDIYTDAEIDRNTTKRLARSDLTQVVILYTINTVYFRPKEM